MKRQLLGSVVVIIVCMAKRCQCSDLNREYWYSRGRVDYYAQQASVKIAMHTPTSGRRDRVSLARSRLFLGSDPLFLSRGHLRCAWSLSRAATYLSHISLVCFASSLLVGALRVLYFPLNVMPSFVLLEPSLVSR